MLKAFRTLRKKGIVGINRRNATYINGYNDRRLYPLVDDKLRTKALAQAAGIAVPQLYGAISIEREIRETPSWLSRYSSGFVIKPVNGSGGNGILVVTEVRDGFFRRASGKRMNADDIRHHLSNVLSGMYSLGGQPDRAMIEYRVTPDDFILSLCDNGVPDFRIVVFQGVPVMAMMRLPTQESDGKANLHLGAIGIGIDLAQGRMLGGVWHDEVIYEDPFTGKPLDSRCVPDWDTLLMLAARCYEITGLGYLGVDIVLDRTHGPLILELNARPGLSIQLANQVGLKPRIDKVQSSSIPGQPARARVDFSKKHFATWRHHKP